MKDEHYYVTYFEQCQLDICSIGSATSIRQQVLSHLL